MKLNKILALALSGVMAVSMLAGCSGSSNNGGDDDQTPVDSTGIAAVVNAAQDKIDFVYSSSLETDLQTALNATAEKANVTTVLRKIQDVTGINEVARGWADPFGRAEEEGELEAINVFKSPSNYTQVAAMNKLADEIEDVVGGLKAYTNKAASEVSVGDDIMTFAYTGEIAMVETTAVDGTTNYYQAKSSAGEFTPSGRFASTSLKEGGYCKARLCGKQRPSL